MRHAGKGGVSYLDDTQPAREGNLLRWLKKIGLERRPKEIQEVLDASEQQGLIDHDEGDMIEGIFDLKQTVAREIMIPRTHIVSVSKDCTREEALNTIIESGHSRIPVYNENVDQIVGILYAKDLLPFWLNGRDDFSIEEIYQEAFFVPGNQANQ